MKYDKCLSSLPCIFVLTSVDFISLIESLTGKMWTMFTVELQLDVPPVQAKNIEILTDSRFAGVIKLLKQLETVILNI